MSAEPPTAAWVQGKRWEDLIEAATSATEADDDRDLTPVSSAVHQLPLIPLRDDAKFAIGGRCAGFEFLRPGDCR